MGRGKQTQLKAGWVVMEPRPCMNGWEGSGILKNPAPFEHRGFPLCEQDFISSVFFGLKPGTPSLRHQPCQY